MATVFPEGKKMEQAHRERVPRHDGQSLIAIGYRCSPNHCMNCPRKLNCVDNPEKGRIVKRLEGQELIDGIDTTGFGLQNGLPFKIQSSKFNARTKTVPKVPIVLAAAPVPILRRVRGAHRPHGADVM